MSEFTRVLERSGQRYHDPQLPLEGVLRKRDRRRRNQRIGAFVVAIVVTGAAFGGLIATLGGEHRQEPANDVITPGNVSDLTKLWVGGASGGAGRPVVADGSVYIGSVHGVVAYPESCTPTESICTPSWTHPSGLVSDLAVSGDLVYTATRFKGISFGALDQGERILGDGPPGSLLVLRADDGSLVQRWRIDAAPEAGPLIAGDHVFVVTRAGTLYAFPLGQTGGRCGASCWTADVGPYGPMMVMHEDGGYLFVGTGQFNYSCLYHCDGGTLSVFPVDCRTTAHGVCDAIGTRSGMGQIFDIWSADNVLYVGTNLGFDDDGPGLYAFDESCIVSGRSCSPLWKGATTCCTKGVTTADGTVVVHDERTGTYGFSGCRTNGKICVPTWEAMEPTVDTLYYQVPVSTGDLAFLGGQFGDVYAMPATCPEPCRPLWDGQASASGVNQLTIADGMVFAGDEGGLTAFGVKPPPDAAASEPGPGAAPVFYLGAALVVAAVYGVRVIRRRRGT